MYTFASCEAVIIPFAVWSITSDLSLRTVRDSSLVKACLLMMWSAAPLSTKYSRRLLDEIACVTFSLALPAPLSCSDFRFALAFPPALGPVEPILAPGFGLFPFRFALGFPPALGPVEPVLAPGLDYLLVFLASKLRLWRSFRSSYGPLFGISHQLFLC